MGSQTDCVPVRTVSPAVAQAAGGEHTAVLVVGPRDALQDAICDWLRERCYAADTVDSGEEALDLVSTRWYDAVIVDAQLGDMSCLQLVRKLRRDSQDQTLLIHRDPFGVVPVLDAMQAGADDVIPRISDREGFDLLELILSRSVRMHRTAREATRLRDQLQNLDLVDLPAHVRRVAHDMNQPLTVILGTADLLLMDLPPDSPLREDLQAIDREARELRRLAASLGSVGLDRTN